MGTATEVGVTRHQPACITAPVAAPTTDTRLLLLAELLVLDGQNDVDVRAIKSGGAVGVVAPVAASVPDCLANSTLLFEAQRRSADDECVAEPLTRATPGHFAHPDARFRGLVGSTPVPHIFRGR